MQKLSAKLCKGRPSQQWRSKGAGGRGPRAALSGGRHFADQNLIFEKSLKVLAFRFYFKYILNVLTLFNFRV